MTRRPPLLTLLASLTVHSGALASLLALSSSESNQSALLVDLSEQETTAEPKAAAMGSGHRAASPVWDRKAATTGGGLRQGRLGPERPVEPVAIPSPSPPAPAAPTSASAPAPSSNLETAPERSVAPPRPEEPRQPAPQALSARHEAPDGLAPSSASPPTVEAQANRGGVSLDRTDSAPDASGDRRAVPGSWGGSGESSGGTRGGVALAPTGSPAGEPGSEYGSYYAGIRRRIQESLQYPFAARRRGLEGTVHLEILIKPDGVISGVSVTGSSSHRLLDEAALEAVRSLAPQPFPAGLRPRPLRVRLPVVFQLQ